MSPVAKNAAPCTNLAAWPLFKMLDHEMASDLESIFVAKLGKLDVSTSPDSALSRGMLALTLFAAASLYWRSLRRNSGSENPSGNKEVKR